MTGIFISYRRDDSAGQAGRLYDRLSARYGRDAVFLDHDDLAPGQDFPAAIDANLARSEVVLILIGPRWCTAADTQGRQRLADPADFVRRELAAALSAGKRVIPLLVGGAKMPAVTEVPPELAALVRLQAWELRDARFDDDLSALLAKMPAPAAAAPASPSVLATLSGQWVAEVKYPWRDQYTERFTFEVDGDELFGTGTFLTGPHPLEEIELLPDGVRFVLHSEASMNGETRRLEHSYRARIEGDTLQVRMQTTNSFGGDGPPLKFTARRA